MNKQMTAVFLEKLMNDFEKIARDKGYMITKASHPRPTNKFYESEQSNHAFIGFCFAHV